MKNIRFCCCLIIAAILFVSAGCGGGNNSSNSMSQAQAAAIAAQIAQAAAHGAINAPSGAIVPHTQPQSITCNQSGCQISEQFSATVSCSLGGSIGLTGDISGSTDASGTGTIQIQGEETLTNCSPTQGFVVNGAPDITLTGNFSFLNGNPSGQQSIVVGGAFSWGGNANQVCQVNLTANFNGSGSGDLSGTLCGHSVNATFQ